MYQPPKEGRPSSRTLVFAVFSCRSADRRYDPIDSPRGGLSPWTRIGHSEDSTRHWQELMPRRMKADVMAMGVLPIPRERRPNGSARIAFDLRCIQAAVQWDEMTQMIQACDLGAGGGSCGGRW
jgi:hypothetical protein